MSLVKQSHRFLTPVTIIYFVLLHKTVGRVKSTFCVSYLLYLLWKRTNSPPPSPFPSLSIPCFCQPSSWLSLDLLWKPLPELHYVGAGSHAGTELVCDSSTCPSSPALSQFCVSSQAHTSPPGTLWRLVPSPLMAQCALWNQNQLLLNLAFSGKWLATWLLLVIPSKARSQEDKKPVGFHGPGIKIWSWQSQFLAKSCRLVAALQWFVCILPQHWSIVTHSYMICLCYFMR